MAQSLFTILLCLVLFIYLWSILAHILKLSASAKLLPWVGLLLLGSIAILCWFQVKRLPVYGIFETSLHLALVFSLLVNITSLRTNFPRIQPWGHLLTAILIGLALTSSGKFNPDYYMYQALQVQLFFFLRLTSGGILLFAFLLFAFTWIHILKYQRSLQSNWLHSAKTALIFGSIVFLCSEFSGTVWCIQGYGDLWHWSTNFFESTAMFLLLMLPLHVPPRVRRDLYKSGTGTLCSLAVVLGIIFP